VPATAPLDGAAKSPAPPLPESIGLPNPGPAGSPVEPAGPAPGPVIEPLPELIGPAPVT